MIEEQGELFTEGISRGQDSPKEFIKEILGIIQKFYSIELVREAFFEWLYEQEMEQEEKGQDDF